MDDLSKHCSVFSSAEKHGVRGYSSFINVHVKVKSMRMLLTIMALQRKLKLYGLPH